MALKIDLMTKMENVLLGLLRNLWMYTQAERNCRKAGVTLDVFEIDRQVHRTMLTAGASLELPLRSFRIFRQCSRKP